MPLPFEQQPNETDKALAAFSIEILFGQSEEQLGAGDAIGDGALAIDQDRCRNNITPGCGFAKASAGLKPESEDVWPFQNYIFAEPGD